MGHFYRFKRGDGVTIVSGRYAGLPGTVDSAVFQRTIDYPDAFSPGYHVIISDGPAVTVRWDQVRALSIGVEEDQ
jgi:hypothetical protein